MNKNYKISPHTISELMKGKIGIYEQITPAQKKELLRLVEKPKLTELQEKLKKELEYKSTLPAEFEISDTIKSICIKTFLNIQYGYREVLMTPAIDKGIQREEESIFEFSKKFPAEYGFLSKNEKTYENEIMRGTPDVVTNDEVLEFKTSYNLETFYKVDQKSAFDSYYAQVQAYLMLTGLKKAKLIFVYLPQTETEILDQLRSLSWKHAEDSPRYIEVENQLRKNQNITLEDNMKIFDIVEDLDYQEKIHNKCTLCIDYIKKLEII